MSKEKIKEIKKALEIPEWLGPSKPVKFRENDPGIWRRIKKK